MSLARTLMNGGMIGAGVSVDSARYGHSMGATRIAMESVEELHEIFMESFYETEQIELAAATEGVVVEGSQYEAMLEATNKSVLQRVKDFLKKLWEKVKAFFHNVKRFIASIMMSGKDFVKKYKADIDKIKTLKDFEFEMYNYNDDRIDTVDELDVEKEVDALIKSCEDVVKEVKAAGDSKIDESVKRVRDEFDDKWEDEIRASCVKLNGKRVSAEDFDEELFKYFRNNATDASDKEKREFTEVKSLADKLTNSKAESDLAKLQTKTDKMYQKALKGVDTLESDYRKAEDMKDKTKMQSAISAVCSELSSSVSKVQTISNKVINAWKAAYKERDAAYKACIVAAMSHYRKQK